MLRYLTITFHGMYPKKQITLYYFKQVSFFFPEEKRNAYVLEENLSEKRKKQLKKLKQKFGLGLSNENAPVTANEYKDRAEIRRQAVGSYSDSFKTETASVTE